VSVVDGVAFHYDSLGSGNKYSAQQLTQKTSALLNKQLRFIQLEDSPQQENGSDCGVFVCLNMRHLLLKRLLMVRSDEKVSMSMGGRRLDAREGRREITRIIEGLRREAVQEQRS
jgi:Ulp1 family protease